MAVNKHQNGTEKVDQAPEWCCSHYEKAQNIGTGVRSGWGGNKEAKPSRQSSLGSLFSWKYFWIIVAFHGLFTKYFVKAKKSLENVSLGGSK